MIVGSEDELTSRLVVADGEVSRNVATSVAETLARAVNSGAADLSGGLPDDLAEVTPLVESRHVGRVLAVLALEETNLAVVEELSDDSRDVVSLDTSSDVLAVSTSVHFSVVGVVAGLADLLGGRGERVAPGKVGSRVVGAVNVVVVNDLALVAGWLRVGSRGGRSKALGLGAGRLRVRRRGRGLVGGGSRGGLRVGRSLLLSLAGGSRSGLGPGGGPAGGPGVALGLPVAVQVVLLGRGGGNRSGVGSGSDVALSDSHVLGGVDDVGLVDDATLLERDGESAGGESGNDCRAHFRLNWWLVSG